MKLYKWGLVVGRFQMFHKGHEQMIRTALELCERVVVFIGISKDDFSPISPSPWKDSYLDNPFSFSMREDMIERVFPKEPKLFIHPLPDIGVGDNLKWGCHVLMYFKNYFHTVPDLFITGAEPGRLKWFDDTIAPKLDTLILSRKDDISASKCRECLRSGNEEEWKKMVPSELYDMFDFLADILKNEEKYKNEKR